MYWRVDDKGNGWFKVDNAKVVNPDWEDGYWLVNGFDSKPMHLTKYAEEELGLKIEPVED